MSKRVFRALPILGASALGLLLSTSRIQAAEKAEECVHLLRSELSTGMSITLNNACGENLACSMSWTVQCENAAGKVSSRERGSKRFTVAAREGQDVLASAEKCTSGWSIDDIAWSCAKTK
jgi:hypothetical protein